MCGNHSLDDDISQLIKVGFLIGFLLDFLGLGLVCWGFFVLLVLI